MSRGTAVTVHKGSTQGRVSFWGSVSGFFRSRMARVAGVPLLMFTLLLTPLVNHFEAEETGDALQVILPVAGFACSIRNGEAASYLMRAVAMEAVIRTSKKQLGRSEINLRPNGKTRGFPSGHTARATFGASYLVHSCLKGNLVAKGAVVLSAGATGGSRIEAGAHFLFQVIAGVLTGWFFERSIAFLALFRRRRAKLT